MHFPAMQHLLNISIAQSPIKITCFQSLFTSPTKAPFLILHNVLVVVVPVCVLRMGWKVAPSSSPSALLMIVVAAAALLLLLQFEIVSQ